MRRLAPIALLAAVLVLVVAACANSHETVSPVAQTVEGPLRIKVLKGDPAAGKKLFETSGCAGCHTYAPAASTGKVGPDLDHLPADAKKANHGSLEDYVKESIVSPNAYIVPGFQPNVMPNFSGQLTPQQVADLVAFLTKPGS